MAAGLSGLTPEQRQLLLQALAQGGQDGMANPMAALQNILGAQGGQSAAQAIVAGLRDRLIPAARGPAAGMGLPSPAIEAARGLSGAEPTYARPEETKPSGILGEQKPSEKKTDDIADLAKKMAEKTPAPAQTAPSGNGILGGNITVPPVPDVPAANVSVNRAVAASNVKSNDRDMAIRMMAMEAGGEGQKGMEAVGHVIMNRAALNTRQYGGNSLTGVVTAPSQFEPWNTRRSEMMRLSPDSPQYKAAAAAFDRVASGESPDPTNGATHFLNVGTMQGRGGVPSWARSMSNRQVLGNHTFGNPDAYKPDQVFQARSLLGEARGQTGEPGPIRAPAQAAGQELQAPTAPTPSFSGAGKRPVQALIVHHTGGREQTADDVKAVYQQRGLAGAHLFMDRQGNISQTLGFDQAGQHIRNGQGPGAGLSNANTIGIEISARDDSDITPEQRAAMKQLYPSLQQQFPGLKVFGHGEINPHKQHTEGATVINDLRNMGKPASEQTDAPSIEDRVGPTTQDPGKVDNEDFTPTTDTDLGPDMTDMSSGSAEDFGSDVGGEGGDFDLGGIGGLLGGLGGGDEGGGADSGPSQLQEWEQEDAKEPEKPILPDEKSLIPDEDTKPGGLLSGDGSLLGNQDQSRVDLSRVFSPEGMGGSGLFGRDQAPETTGFKAPVSLPGAGAPSSPSADLKSGILTGAPATGLANLVPSQLKSIAAPLPPPRPAGLGAGMDTPNFGAQTLAPPDVPLPPPRPPGIGGEIPLPPRRPSDLGGLGAQPQSMFDQGMGLASPEAIRRMREREAAGLPLNDPIVPPTPGDRAKRLDTLGQDLEAARRQSPGSEIVQSPTTPSGLLSSPPAVDPDRMLRDSPVLSPPAVDPDRMVRDAPWQDPPKPSAGLLGTPNTPESPGDIFSGLTKGMGILSDTLGRASGQQQAKRRQGSSPSAPLIPPMAQESLLGRGGLLSSPRAGIDLNRYFGLLSGRMG